MRSFDMSARIINVSRPMTSVHPPFDRIAVTGGAGYLGTLTCQHLRAMGRTIRSIDSGL